MQPTVFVLQESVVPGSNGVPMDYQPAERFGEVQFVLNQDPANHSGSQFNDEIQTELVRMAEIYKPNHDYVILTGSPLSIMMAGAAFAAVNKPVTLLKWDRRDRAYRPIRLNLTAN